MAEPTNSPDAGNLIWVDMEMSGLSPETDRILELALVVTDSQLEVVAEGPVLVVHQGDEVLASMDAWNRSMHAKSGLIERVRAARTDEAAAQEIALAFVARHAPQGTSPMCGNSVCQDRRFLARWMPRLEAHFHYRNLDVSTLKELVRRWKPEVYRALKKEGRHQALADIHESIEELRYYRRTVMSI